MGVFLEAEQMLNEMLYELASNQTIMKYVTIDDNSVDPATLPDITDTQQYIYKPVATSVETDYRLFALPKLPFITEEKKSFVLCWLEQTSAANTPQVKDYRIVFDVVCHIDEWQIAGGISRPLRILDEINNVFFLRPSSASLKVTPQVSCDYAVYDTKGYFCGYRLIYEGAAFGKSLCR